jgi:hypothetical protein
VNNAQQELEVIYFPLPPLIRIYWQKHQIQEYRDNVLEKINRDNPEEKVMDLQEKSLDIIMLMVLLNKIYMMPDRRPVIGHLYKYIAEHELIWIYILICLTLIINFLMVVLMTTDGDDVVLKYEWG